MIIIDARRWFDKVYGNTYHSVKVSVDGKHIGKVDFAYGYGRQYLQSAHEILVKACYAKPDYSDFLDDMRENREGYYETVSDVSRKKDL